MIFIDTNFFLRYFLDDVNSQSEEAKDLFLRASDGEFKLFTSTIVLFEVYWVLLGQFKKNKQKIGNVMDKLLSMKFIDIENSDLLEKAMVYYKTTNLGLVDVYNIVYSRSKNAREFKTFDKDLIKKLLKNKESEKKREK
ncbi:PIN domain-containing protein [Candidatus Microgenomates bacterium]|nr:PIN domain-containing protein [Candidatus Microgenomates bacterium]